MEPPAMLVDTRLMRRLELVLSGPAADMADGMPLY